MTTDPAPGVTFAEAVHAVRAGVDLDQVASVSWGS